MTNDLDPADRVVVDLLRHALADLVSVYRFGSSAHGTTHRASDADLALLARRRLDPGLRFDLQERLAGVLGHDVDLIDLVAASTVMAMQVVATGRLLYDGDPAARGDFEDRTFSSYARLNEERRGILDRISREGTVYGR